MQWSVAVVVPFVDVPRTATEQQRHHGVVACGGGVVQGGVAVEVTHRCLQTYFLEEIGSYSRVATQRCQVKRRESIRSAAVRVSPERDEFLE